jgi:hypothetical protein
MVEKGVLKSQWHCLPVGSHWPSRITSTPDRLMQARLTKSRQLPQLQQLSLPVGTLIASLTSTIGPQLSHVVINFTNHIRLA